MDKKEFKGRLFVVSGPSGSGKSTFIQRLLAEDGKCAFSISYTTRERRPQETDGKDYYFVDEETFASMAEKGGFLEWEKVYNNLYGTPKSEIFQALHKGLDIVLDIDVKGALNVKREYPRACLIFIEPPSREELVRRLTGRGEKEIDRRVGMSQEEIDKKRFFDYTVLNDDADNAYKRFKEIIEHIRGR